MQIGLQKKTKRTKWRRCDFVSFVGFCEKFRICVYLRSSAVYFRFSVVGVIRSDVRIGVDFAVHDELGGPGGVDQVGVGDVADDSVETVGDGHDHERAIDQFLVDGFAGDIGQAADDMGGRIVDQRELADGGEGIAGLVRNFVERRRQR